MPAEPALDGSSGRVVEEEQICPLQESARILGNKWELVILGELYKNPGGFNELKHRIRGISSRILAKKLRNLEAAGLVVRTVVTKTPLRVCYDLTRTGKELGPLFEILRKWGARHGFGDSTSRKKGSKSHRSDAGFPWGLKE